MLWCFACLHAEHGAEPEVTFDEADALVQVLDKERLLLSARAGIDESQGGQYEREEEAEEEEKEKEKQACVEGQEEEGEEERNKTLQVQRYFESRRRVICDAMAALQSMMTDSASLSDGHRAVYTTATAILSAQQCRAVVRAAEAHAAEHGWSTRRHAAYPTHDLPYTALGKTGAWMDKAVRATLLPELARRFQLRLGALSIADMFVAKYSVVAGGLAELEEHEVSPIPLPNFHMIEIMHD